MLPNFCVKGTKCNLTPNIEASMILLLELLPCVHFNLLKTNLAIKVFMSRVRSDLG